MEFEWDEAKAAANLELHGVSFPEASTAFGDPLSVTIADPDHSEDEQRFILLGLTFSGRLVAAAIRVIEIDEVLLASTASGLQASSRPWKSLSLR